MQAIEQLEAALAALNSQRVALGDEIVNLMIAPLQLQLQARHPQAPGPTGERKLVTIMFADISGFTAMSERLDPEQVRRIMNGCFDALVPCIQRYDGTIDKFIGDAVMALFGAPVAQENHAESAARANLPVYVGVGKGHLAWVDVQRGRFTSAEQNAREGLGLAASFPMKWMITLPLVRALHERGGAAESVPLLEQTLAGLQRLAPPVEEALRAVIAANEAHDAGTVHERVGELLNGAVQHNYL